MRLQQRENVLLHNSESAHKFFSLNTSFLHCLSIQTSSCNCHRYMWYWMLLAAETKMLLWKSAHRVVLLLLTRVIRCICWCYPC